jgi:hypothetical protein
MTILFWPLYLHDYIYKNIIYVSMHANCHTAHSGRPVATQVPPEHGLVHCRLAACKAASLVEPTGQPAADGTVAATARALVQHIQ